MIKAQTMYKWNIIFPKSLNFVNKNLAMLKYNSRDENPGKVLKYPQVSSVGVWIQRLTYS